MSTEQYDPSFAQNPQPPAPQAYPAPQGYAPPAPQPYGYAPVLQQPSNGIGVAGFVCLGFRS